MERPGEHEETERYPDLQRFYECTNCSSDQLRVVSFNRSALNNYVLAEMHCQDCGRSDSTDASFEEANAIARRQKRHLLDFGNDAVPRSAEVEKEESQKFSQALDDFLKSLKDEYPAKEE